MNFRYSALSQHETKKNKILKLRELRFVFGYIQSSQTFVVHFHTFLKFFRKVSLVVSVFFEHIENKHEDRILSSLGSWSRHLNCSQFFTTFF